LSETEMRARRMGWIMAGACASGAAEASPVFA
jgi:hypothetical protein